MKPRILALILLVNILFLLFLYFDHGKIVLSNNYSDSMIRGVYNMVTLRYNGKIINPENYSIEIDSGSYKVVDKKLYLYSTTPESNLKITDRWGRCLYKSKVHFNQLIMPQLLSNTCMYIQGSIYPGGLNDWEGIILYTERNYAILDTLRIIEYTATVQMGNETIRMKISGQAFTDELKSYIKRLKHSDRLSIEKVRYQTYDGKVHDLFINASIYIDYHIDVAGYFAAVKMAEFNDPEKHQTFNFDSIEYFYRQYGIPVGYSEDSMPRVTYTNCGSKSDTCSTVVYTIEGGRRWLSHSYAYMDSDIVHARWYHHDTLLSDVYSKHDELCGPFTLYYRNGAKRLEGHYDIKDTSITTTNNSYVNPVTLIRSNRTVKQYKHVAKGEWRRYDKTGTLIMAREY